MAVVRRRARRGGVAPAATAPSALATAALFASLFAWDPCSPPATLFASPGTRAVCEAQQQKERREAPEDERPAPSPPPASAGANDNARQRAASRQLVREILGSDVRARTQELVDAAVGVLE